MIEKLLLYELFHFVVTYSMRTGKEDRRGIGESEANAEIFENACRTLWKRTHPKMERDFRTACHYLNENFYRVEEIYNSFRFGPSDGLAMVYHAVSESQFERLMDEITSSRHR